MAVIGVDGCARGWFAVRVASGEVDACFVERLDDLGRWDPEVDVVAIDIPLGFPDRGVRPSELAVREFLGPRRHSLFLTPPREALTEPDHGAASLRCRQLTGRGLTRQAYNLREKVFEAESFRARHGAIVHESHPETSFAVALGHPAVAGKKTWAGLVERRQVLAEVGLCLDGLPTEAGRHAAPDDVLDAGILAWTAGRIRAGTARRWSDEPLGPGVIWA